MNNTQPAALIRRFPLTSFFLWFFVVGQAIVFVPLAAEATSGVQLPSSPFLIAGALLGLLLPALVITRITDGPDGLRALRDRMMRFALHPGWYALVVLGVPLLSVAAIAAAAGWTSTSGLSTLWAFALEPVHLVVVFITVNWAEETAWMGFVQARLQGRHGPVRAAMLTGPIFAFGHISQLIEASLSATLTLLALMIAICIPFRALLAWVYNRTGSIALVGLLHASANATAAGSIAGTGLLDRLYPDAGHGGAVIPMLAVLGLVVLLATRGGLGTTRRPSPAPARATTPTTVTS